MFNSASLITRSLSRSFSGLLAASRESSCSSTSLLTRREALRRKGGRDRGGEWREDRKGVTKGASEEMGG